MAPHEVVMFIQLIRAARAASQLRYRRTREKNRSTLIAPGCTVAEMFDCVAAMEPEQALGPPRQSTNPAYPEERVCEFGTVVQGQSVYVKVCVVGLEEGASGCVVSFHFPEQPLVFPYRERR